LEELEVLTHRIEQEVVAEERLYKLMLMEAIKGVASYN
jgi:hypothetical protein